ncbi:tRNA (adenosine(37)-N6)-dimethylallyltransferase MiaA [Tautonia sociabilis]|uniref:tRNA dimethylallyltransferase n=1 Tax=Tautonia sociabilis TaxID=2080755 RepID=A0A432MP67_9BACT|nr:tRNA (adenosine(37)-N6)-dimethylallyltransferase MiaA [Tautonia sociabilis]
MPETSLPFHRSLYLTGPTASGKTAVGVALAIRLGAEVVALDSMTLYRGMDIGTAKPSESERRGVPHHLIDVLDPWESASVAWYRAMAAAAVAAIEERGRIPLFVGGTPMYLKALLRGLFPGPSADPSLRLELEDEANRLGDAALHARLAAADPATASRLHPNDRRRIIRALEVLACSGRPLSDWQREHDRPAPPHVPVLALDRPRDELRRRIDARVESMFNSGLIDEARRLADAPRPLHPVPSQAAGYREALDLLAGRIPTEAQAIALVQARTRQLAKRQATWFRGLSEVAPVPLSGDEPPEATADRLLPLIAAIRSRPPGP